MPRAYKRWTSEELEVVRRDYGRVHIREIAKSLGRKTERVYSKAAKMGLRHRPGSNSNTVVVWHREANRTLSRPVLVDLRKLRALHARGYTDVELGVALGCGHYSAYKIRKKLGLPHTYKNRAPAVRASQAAIFKKYGMSLNGLSRLRIREEAQRSAWPSNLPKRQRQILDLLWQHGVMTRQQIAEGYGKPEQGKSLVLINTMCTLQKRGLVCHLPGSVNKGKASVQRRYMLSLWVEPKKEQEGGA